MKFEDKKDKILKSDEEKKKEEINDRWVKGMLENMNKKKYI